MSTPAPTRLSPTFAVARFWHADGTPAVAALSRRASAPTPEVESGEGTAARLPTFVASVAPGEGVAAKRIHHPVEVSEVLAPKVAALRPDDPAASTSRVVKLAVAVVGDATVSGRS